MADKCYLATVTLIEYHPVYAESEEEAKNYIMNMYESVYGIELDETQIILEEEENGKIL
jgi:hypothetical protein